MELTEEAAELQRLLAGKTVRDVWRHRATELGIQFTDGTRLFVDMLEAGLGISVTAAEGMD